MSNTVNSKLEDSYLLDPEIAKLFNQEEMEEAGQVKKIDDIPTLEDSQIEEKKDPIPEEVTEPVSPKKEQAAIFPNTNTNVTPVTPAASIMSIKKTPKHAEPKKVVEMINGEVYLDAGKYSYHVPKDLIDKFNVIADKTDPNVFHLQGSVKDYSIFMDLINYLIKPGSYTFYTDYYDSRYHQDCANMAKSIGCVMMLDEICAALVNYVVDTKIMPDALMLFKYFGKVQCEWIAKNVEVVDFRKLSRHEYVEEDFMAIRQIIAPWNQSIVKKLVFQMHYTCEVDLGLITRYIGPGSIDIASDEEFRSLCCLLSPVLDDADLAKFVRDWAF
nr:hypothetical protein K-LCC10_0160 [Kaumoebavirus]